MGIPRAISSAYSTALWPPIHFQLALVPHALGYQSGSRIFPLPSSNRNQSFPQSCRINPATTRSRSSLTPYTFSQLSHHPLATSTPHSLLTDSPPVHACLPLRPLP